MQGRVIVGCVAVIGGVCLLLLAYLGAYFMLGNVISIHRRSLDEDFADTYWVEQRRQFASNWQKTLFQPLVEWETSRCGKVAEDDPRLWGVLDCENALLNGQMNSTAASVNKVIPDWPAIVHIRDWRWVARDVFAADTGLAGQELDDAYDLHLRTVMAVQAAQREMLIGDHGPGRVYVEGLARSDMPSFTAMVQQQKRKKQSDTLMRMGAAAQVMVDDNGLMNVLPAEGESFRKAAPRSEDGFELDLQAQEAREDEIVRNLANGGVLILDGAHDLSDNIKRLGLRLGYIVVTPKGYPAAEGRVE
jgi:hypothetical protein